MYKKTSDKICLLAYGKQPVPLSVTDLPVSGIADRLGFDDPYYFSRLFKKSTGHSPRKFRNIHLTDSRSNYMP
jgi:AraC-like DNA-binding protein